MAQGRAATTSGAWRRASSPTLPLTGAGAGNFAQDYARERRTREEPLYPHSVVWRTLGQTGLVGARSSPASSSPPAGLGARARSTRRRVAVAALVPAAAWLAHASVDWLWELPALTAPAFALPRARRRLGRDGARGTPARRAGRIGGHRGARRARGRVLRRCRRWRRARSSGRSPAGTTIPPPRWRGLERARTLDPLGDRADVIAGVLARRDGDLGARAQAFRRRSARDPDDWYAQTQLALVELGRATAAAAAVPARPRARLNPLEPAIAVALEAARRGQPVPAWSSSGWRRSGAGAARTASVDCRPVFGLSDCPGGPEA